MKSSDHTILYEENKLGNSKTVYEDDKWLFLIPLDKEATCFYGTKKEKQWCFASLKRGEYEEYFLDKTNTIVFAISKTKDDRFVLIIDENNLKLKIYDEDENIIPREALEQNIGISLEEIISKSITISNSDEVKLKRKEYQKYLKKIDDLLPSVEQNKPNKKLELFLVLTKNGERIMEYVKKVGVSSGYSQAFQFIAVNHHGNLIKYIVNPSELVMIDAVIRNPYSIQYIKNPSEKVQLAAVSNNGHVIKYLKSASEKVQLASVGDDGLSINFIKNPSQRIQKEAVTQNGFAIQFIKNPDDEIKLAAVKQNGKSIRYITNPSLPVQANAVKRNGLAIEYIENPTEQIQAIAVSKNGNALQFITNPSEKVQLIAVAQNGNAIQHVENPSKKVKIIALRQNPKARKYLGSEQ